MADELAVLGGPKAISVDTSEQWPRPVEEQKAAVCQVIEEGTLSGAGRGVPKEFEDRFREYIGCKYVLTTSHGHSAIASGFFAAGLGPGDEFITPTIGYIGSYAGALHLGATPVFCEIDPDTLLMDPADAEARITRKTRVLAPIHSCGRVCDMDALLGLAEKHDLVVVEDAAHAHGSEWGGVKIGNVGHIACFSMQGSIPGGKPVAGGEAGIVATNDRELYERALIYCHLHRPGALEELTNPVYKQLEPQLLGWKWRAHPLAMALGLVSLKYLPYRLEHLAANREALFERIWGLPGIRPVRDYTKAKGVELFGGIKLVYDAEELGGLPASKFVEAMQAEGASIRLGFGVHHLEHVRSLYTRDLPGLWGPGHIGPADVPLPRYKMGDFPVSESMPERVMSFKGHINAADGFIEQFATAFRKVIHQHRKLL
ncbi:MAG: aminotransferase class I/II-fold pyridoxal phosphate-dependent enzyme [Candidatus Latescibacteria bacterium]|jgi:dTDP-4-amino-4,6-dideoxygalactose transaminase|nr:aminotransferase class I/II-fold pyridoxal phosphate-dependent enzyme [Candidatus Latescibacterota bacterium]